MESFSLQRVSTWFAKLMGLAALLALPRVAVASATPAALDLSFDPGVGPDAVVRTVLIEPDGKIVIAGAFAAVGATEKLGVARLTTAGELDSGFASPLVLNAEVRALGRQVDGRIVIGGNFSTSPNGFKSIARLNSDGQLDASFNPTTGANDGVWALATLEDQKVLIGGDFTFVAANPRNRVARLNANGTIDTGFGQGAPLANDSVRSVKALSNGQILIGGNFTQVNGVTRNRIARLNGDGSLDMNFDPGDGADSWVSALVVQPDGRVLIGGSFISVDGSRRSRMARLNSDGSVDPTFDPGAGANDTVASIALQADGKIVIAGGFTAVDGVIRNRIARLYSNGEIDPFFESDQGANDWVETAVVEADGRILIGGNFTLVNQTQRIRVARLQGGDPAPSAPLIAATPENISANAGSELVLRANARAVPQPAYRWFLNGTELAGATRDTLRLQNLQTNQSGNYRVEVSNSLGVATAEIASVTVAPAPMDPGAPDLNFYNGAGPNAVVHALAVQADDKVLIAGAFTFVDGLPHRSVARLQQDGSLDETFQAQVSGVASSVVVRPSGKILIGGALAADAPGVLRVAQLNSDGSLDQTFQASPVVGPQSTLSELLLLPDEKLIIGGDLAIFEGGVRRDTPLALLESNGALVPGFSFISSIGAKVHALALEPDDQIVVGGFFSSVGGIERNQIVRINLDGSVDQSFDPGPGPNGSVRAIAIQGDGRLVIAGRFTRIGGVFRMRVARLNSDGSLDPSFDAGALPTDDDVTSVALQSDGKILIGSSFDDGDFAIARLHPDGSLDGTFRSLALPNHPSLGPSGGVEAIEVLDDGKVLVAGDFETINNVPRPRVARLLGGDPAPAPPILLDAPTDASVMAGRDLTFEVVASSVPSPSYQWQFEGVDLAGENRSYLTLRNVRYAHGGLYTVVVTNALGAVTSVPARLTILQPPLNAGAPDIGFFSGFGPNERVHVVVVQPDGRIIIGGEFTQVDGQTRNHVARLNRNGSLDQGFDPGSASSDTVHALALQADGKILVGGWSANSGVLRAELLRLNSDGSVDQTFNAATNLAVSDIIAQPDGTILVGGFSANANSVPLVRLIADGSPQPAFSSGYAGSSVAALAVQPDNAIVAAGDIVSRLLPNGAIDSTFNPNPKPPAFVNAIALEPDGQILLGGQFQSGSPFPPHLARLNSDGSLDPAFLPQTDGLISAIAVQPNSSILVGGSFTTVNGAARKGLVRLNSNGSVDLSFDVGEGFAGGTLVIDEYGEYGDILKEAAVLAIALEGDNSAIIGGNFTTVNGASRPYVARVFLREGSTIDSDEDNLPDWWELQYGLDAYSATADQGGSGDFDDDGRTNRTEFINGTNPVRGDSIEPLITVTETSPGVFTLAFVTLRDRTYRIHYSPDLQQPFAPIAPPIVGTGGVVTWTDDGTQTGGNPMPERFYKLQVELAPAQ
ncbi:MAG: immunoglobulin domain-containing protein [Verrucomicrobiales bacterium]